MMEKNAKIYVAGHRGIYRPGNGDALHLPFGQTCAALTQHGI